MKRMILLAAVLMAGCATAGKMNRVSLGMTKANVISQLGSPASTSAEEGVEYLTYHFYTTDNDALRSTTTPYFVKIVEGKVVSYGKFGDFGSAARAETKSTVDLNVTTAEAKK